MGVTYIHRGGELEQGNVVPLCAGLVVGVVDDLGHGASDNLALGVGAEVVLGQPHPDLRCAKILWSVGCDLICYFYIDFFSFFISCGVTA